MENSQTGSDREIVFSKNIKAGKRYYYLDVKKNKRGELFLTITESLKVTCYDSSEQPYQVIEKHKIFLYKEDFDCFTDGLAEVISYVKKNNTVNFVPQYAKETNDFENTEEPVDDSSIENGEGKIVFNLDL